MSNLCGAGGEVHGPHDVDGEGGEHDEHEHGREGGGQQRAHQHQLHHRGHEREHHGAEHHRDGARAPVDDARERALPERTTVSAHSTYRGDVAGSAEATHALILGELGWVVVAGIAGDAGQRDAPYRRGAATHVPHTDSTVSPSQSRLQTVSKLPDLAKRPALRVSGFPTLTVKMQEKLCGLS